MKNNNTWVNQHWKIPADVVHAGLEKAKGATYMGAALEELTRDELLAIAAILGHAKNNDGWRG